MGLSPALVQSLAVPKPDSSASAIVVSGGKQYRVAPGDRILVDRLSAELGSSLKLGRVLLLNDGGAIKVGAELEGLDVEAKVISHPRGPRTESLRYKSKKRVRVHHGGRSHLTALEIIAVGGIGLPVVEEEEKETKPKRRAKAAPRKKAKAEPKAEVVEEPIEEEATAEPAKEAVKKPARRRTKKESE
jgi:large subunit ribosomal protein L21